MSMYRRRLMITNALKRSDGNINYPGIIAAWSAKGKTNDDADRAILKDLTGNGHDITLNGFDFSEMSGYGGYKTNMLNWKYNKNSAVILSSQNKFITYNTLEIATHFWDYVSEPPLGTIHRPSFKLKISGLNEDEAVYYSYVDGEDFSVRHEGNLYNGINIFPEINAEIVTEKLPYTTVFEIQSQRILNKEITFEILPEYPDALVFDGVDDYGINENMPILTDYTIIVKRYRIGDKGCVIAKTGYPTSIDGNNWDFILEGGSDYASSTWSLSVSNKKNIISEDITFQTKNSYNGETISYLSSYKGKANCLTIAKLYPNDSRLLRGAFYSAYLFDRSLDEQEIKSFIRKYIDPEYLLPSEILTPDCYYDFSQGSNDDENRDTIKDYSGNGNDAVAHNFAWKGMSGYGGHNCYFSSNSGVDRYEGSFTKDKAHITKIINEVNKNLINIYIINNFNIKISGLTGNNLVRIGPPNVSTLSLSNGTHKIDSSLFPEGYNYSIGILGDIGECDITIEILPEYPGALVFDGVDDYISLDAFDSGFKTMFMKFKPINTINAGYYDQIKKGESKYYFSVSGNSSDIAFSYRNTNGKTYINGILNTSILSKDVVNKTVCIGIVNENVTADNTTIPKIGDGTHFTPWFANMALYKFLGFKEALTEEQIQAVIKKYNLLDGVDEIEVS